MEHLDAGTVQALLGGTLEPGARARAEAHVDGCEECRLVIGELVRAELVVDSSLVRGSGERLGDRYELIEPLGRGGMGVVYRARPTRGGPEVALKMMRAGGDPDDLARFRREARVAAGLSHPGLVRVVDHGETEDGTLFLAMELLHGTDLGRRLHERGRLAPVEAVAIARAAAAALGAAHEHGIVHRDVKPPNLFLCTDGSVKVVDFGLAVPYASGRQRVTRRDVLVGTPGYMAVEQVRCLGNEDPRTDVWGLGATLYHMVSGRLPFTAVGRLAQLVRIATDEPDPLPDDVPPWLGRVILRALRKERAERHPTMEAFAAALAAGPAGDAATEVARPRTPRSVVVAQDVASPERFRERMAAEGGAVTQILGGFSIAVFDDAAGRAAAERAMRAAEAARTEQTAGIVAVATPATAHELGPALKQARERAIGGALGTDDASRAFVPITRPAPISPAAHYPAAAYPSAAPAAPPASSANRWLLFGCAIPALLAFCAVSGFVVTYLLASY